VRIEHTQTHQKTWLLCATALILSACETSGAVPYGHNDTYKNQIDTAISKSTKPKAEAPLSVLERRYNRRQDNLEAAVNYAAALRRNDYINRAEIILKPFIEGSEDTSSTAKSEYAAIMLAKGNYDDAEKFAKQAIKDDKTNFRAFQRLGIALDTKAMHEEAERAFRKALELWEGDPTSIMNNLALNLASQKKLDEAADILQKAKTLSPERTEIERNLRIITALQQSHTPPVPKPGKKPEFNSKTTPQSQPAQG